MKTLYISVLNKVAVSSARNKIVCGNSDYQIQFIFDSEWDNQLVKTARFVYGGKYIDVVFEGNVCTVPRITNTTSVDVGVYAGNLSTTTPAAIPCERSILCESGLPEEPDEADEYYEQIVKLIEEGAVKGPKGDPGNPEASVVQTKGYDSQAVMSQKAVTDELDLRANALVGNESGTVVAMDDVSPLEHKIPVKVRSKNLIPYPYRTNTTTIDGVTFTDNGDGTVTLNGIATNAIIYAPIVASNSVYLEPGTYTVSSDVIGNYGWFYLQFKAVENDGNIGDVLATSKTFTINEARHLRFNLRISAGASFSDVVVKPQLEPGTTATPYTPYVPDDTEVTVKSCGKNLASYPYDKTTTTKNGITWTDNGDGTITVNGTATNTGTAGYVSVGFVSYVNYPVGTYIYSGCPVGGGNGKYLVNIMVKDFDDKYIVDTWETGNGLKVNATRRIKSIHSNIRIYEGVTVNNLVFKPMFELGSVVSPFVPYTGQTVTATVGEGAELTSIAPNMTITTDNPNVNVEVNYTKDTNKVIEKLVQAIISLGGNI